MRHEVDETVASDVKGVTAPVLAEDLDGDWHVIHGRFAGVRGDVNLISSVWKGL